MATETRLVPAATAAATAATAAGTDPSSLAITLADVEAAAGRLAGVAHRTPVFRGTAFDDAAGRPTWFKAEQFQRSGSFKFRGAYNRLATLDPETRARGVVAFSSGNHAQAVALAARLFGVRATVVMPSDAPAVKRAATEAYGAEVVPYDRLTGDRAAIAARLAAEHGATVVPPFDDPAIMAGQGTATLEFLDDAPDLDVVVAPVGGGGLISGTAVAAKGRRPDIRVVGVETEAANDAQRSLRSGEVVAIAPPDTIADGIRTTSLGRLTWPVVRTHVDDIVTVSEAEVRAALRFLLLRLKLVVEPTGAVGAAAVLFGKLDGVVPPGARAGVILCGGNAAPETLAEILAEGA